MNQKIIIGILVAVLIVGGIYFVMNRNSEQPSNYQVNQTPTQSSNPATANWKIYKNEQYGFEVKIPQDYKADMLGTGGGGGESLNQVGIIFTSETDYRNNPRVNIYLPVTNDITYNPNAKSLKDYEKNYSRTYKTDNSDTLTVVIENNQELAINSVTALKQIIDVSPKDFMGAPVDHATRYVFFKGNYFIILHPTDGTASDIKLLDEIASTFKFIK